jgi:hypothetical protein
MKHTSTYLALSTNKMFAIEQRNIHSGSIRPLHSARVTVWCAVANFGVTGPYFFEDEDGRAVTVTSARYVEMLRNFLTPEISRRGIELSTIWSQQDGAATYTARASMEFVRERLPQRVISLRGELPWPARSPNLSACDYFL